MTATQPLTPTTIVPLPAGGGEPTIGDLEQALRARGVQTPIATLVARASLEAIARTIAWWDRQDGVGPGVLVEAIRRGGIAEQADMLERQHAYAVQICDWLSANFPELVRDGRPHPAAIAAVIGLHYRHGKGRLTRREHGDTIRSAVAAFDRNLTPLEDQ